MQTARPIRFGPTDPESAVLHRRFGKTIIFAWHGFLSEVQAADVLSINLAPAVTGSDSTPRPQEGFQAGEFVLLKRFVDPRSGEITDVQTQRKLW